MIIWKLNPVISILLFTMMISVENCWYTPLTLYTIPKREAVYNIRQLYSSEYWCGLKVYYAIPEEKQNVCCTLNWLATTCMHKNYSKSGTRQFTVRMPMTGSSINRHWKTSFEKKKSFLLFLRWRVSGIPLSFDQQRLIGYVFCLWDMVCSWRSER